MSLKSRIIIFFAAIDIFAYPLSSLLTFKGSFKYSTVSTKITTIFVILLSFSSFFYFSESMMTNRNPLTLLKEENIYDPEEVIMNSDNFFFSFAMENGLEDLRDFIDQTVYIVEAKLQTWKYGLHETSVSHVPLQIEPCNEKHIPTKNPLRESFLEKNFTHMYCFKNYSEVRIKGTWGLGFLKNIKISIRPCDNITENNTCKSPEIISKMIEGSYMSIYYTTVSASLEDFDNPIKRNLLFDFHQTSLEMASDIDFFFWFC